MGYFLTRRLLAEGHRVTLLNRGITRDDLPEDLPRLRCDRTDRKQLRRALEGREFDAVVDTALFKGPEAEAIAEILQDRTGHYIFISTGQVYLVREGLKRPFRETDYDGPTMAQPELNTYDYEEWLYGIEKRAAEDVLFHANKASGFPVTALRLPMVNSERDGFKRLYGYLLRIRDGGPILVPDEPNYAVRNIYAGDVVNAIAKIIKSGQGKGRAFNISQEETVSLEELLGILGELLGIEPRIEVVRRSLLKANGFLPDCSPFSDTWMSELDNTRSKEELGIEYTPLREYLGRIIAHYEEHPPVKPTSYQRRNAEKNLIVHNT